MISNRHWVHYEPGSRLKQNESESLIDSAIIGTKKNFQFSFITLIVQFNIFLSFSFRAVFFSFFCCVAVSYFSVFSFYALLITATKLPLWHYTPWEGARVIIQAFKESIICSLHKKVKTQRRHKNLFFFSLLPSSFSKHFDVDGKCEVILQFFFCLVVRKSISLELRKKVLW